MTITNVDATEFTRSSTIEVAIMGWLRRGSSLLPWRQPWCRHRGAGAGTEFVPRLMMPIVLAFDHRVNDGAEAQRFLERRDCAVRNPERLLMGLASVYERKVAMAETKERGTRG